MNARAPAIVIFAAAAFHLAFIDRRLAPVILIYLFCLIELTRLASPRQAFYSGLSLGFLVFAPRLMFFHTIFGLAAVPLWGVLAFWHGLFAYLGHRFQSVLLLPIFWTGLEYFRSELYPLKFSWLSPAFAFGPTAFGAYGLTFVLMLGLAILSKSKHRLVGSALLLALCFIPIPSSSVSGPTLKIAGIQLEFPVELEVPAKLNLLKQAHPDADLYVLSEYTFDGPVPPCVLKWCKRNSKHLVVGAKDPLPSGNYYNTAFVIDPKGEIVFKQVKAVPIQFFKDGLPAPSQQLWNSPWGKIGLAICYDLSYTRVTDELIRQGAQIIINPTMDVADWGRQQHELHSWIAPMRAAEYRIPIFRLASSGISQAVSASGEVLASGSFPGEGEIVASTLTLNPHGRLPWDRFVAPVCSGITLAAFIFGFLKPRRIH